MKQEIKKIKDITDTQTYETGEIENKCGGSREGRKGEKTYK